ncbi:SGNH/GDSL hydrolase family protein [Exiguobacterium sp. s102]|uniref:SGNH/GDSL hydrolase family protein n=1 Tax=Exiguobacterium sp. s102 TaxID=2751212 RepID=UPI001BE7FCE3|nr:SGNH/GDSL hydrolase family protein [Exiguobacterium sp. s102]
MADFSYKQIGLELDLLNWDTTNDNFEKIGKDLTNVQRQVNNLVIEGDSSPEAAQARIGADGTTYDSLKDRLDEEQRIAAITLGNVEIQTQEQIGQLETQANNLNVTRATYSYVDQKFSVVGSATPKGTYATLSALQAAFPSGNSNIYVITADGKWYYWSGTAWAPGGVYQATTLPEKSVSPEKTSFMTPGKNLFDPVKADLPGKLLNYNDGSVTTNNADHIATSDYLALTPGQVYVINKKYNIAFYDANKAFLTAEKIAVTKEAGTNFTMPATARYIRLSFAGYSTNTNVANEAQIETGTVSTTFEAFRYTLNTDNISNISTTQIKDGAITVPKADFFVPGKNKYDKSKALDGFLINGTTGTFQAWASHSMSDWIPLKPSTTYAINGRMNYALYDSNKTYITGQNSVFVSTFTTTSNTAFIRFSLDTVTYPNIKNTFQLEEGTLPTLYTPFNLVLDPLRMSLPETVNEKFKTLKWNVLGDSITEANKYQLFAGARLGFSVVRSYGIGGTKLADTSGSDANAMVNRYVNMDNDADVITVMGGTNDWGQSVVISNPANKYDKSTLTGAIRTIIEGLIAKYPGKYIVWATLPQRNNQTFPSGVNANGNTTAEYAEAIKSVCREYAIPCIDVHNESGINKLNMDTNGSLMPDKVHPSDAGHKRIAALYMDMFQKIVY